ncbi:hypothetical protein [Flavobacterium sp. CAU 1735]|uniref:hypothetical protein n=1 Tax=Flavobacterium sp. CAU 1735 TaxID=3140361 RepID=UPI0032615A49
MELKITLEIDSAAQHKAATINSLSQELNSFFEDKNYGEDIQSILIGCICVKTKMGYEDWFKIRKPNYISYKKTKNRLTGVEMEISKTLECDFKLDDELYDSFVLSNDEEGVKMILIEMIKAFEQSIELPKKVKDFNKDLFLSDIKLFYNTSALKTMG